MQDQVYPCNEDYQDSYSTASTTMIISQTIELNNYLQISSPLKKTH